MKHLFKSNSDGEKEGRGCSSAVGETEKETQLQIKSLLKTTSLDHELVSRQMMRDEVRNEWVKESRKRERGARGFSRGL